MRTRFALAAALCVIAVSSVAPAFEREAIEPGDSVVGEIRVPYTFGEFPIRAARGSMLTLTIAKAGPGSGRPVFGLFDSVYTSDQNGLSAVSLVGLSATTARTASPLGSGTYRIVATINGGGVGAYRLKTSMKPQTRFVASGTAATPAPTITFGAYAGFDATVTIKWKGPDPVTLRGIVGPDGAAVTSAQTPRATATSFVLSGFHAATLGDHVAQFDVPFSTTSWSATVQLAGKLPRGTTHDIRRSPALERTTIEFPSPGIFPVAVVVGEVGGPNGTVISSSGAAPYGTFLHGGGGAGSCARYAPDNGSADFVLYCNDGFSAQIVNVVRWPDGPWKDLIRGFDAIDVRSPQGSGTTTLSEVAYDASGRPTGWTEVRRFDESGATHTLVFSGATYGIYDAASRGIATNVCAGFRVVHTGPDGAPRTYDYGPFR